MRNQLILLTILAATSLTMRQLTPTVRPEHRPEPEPRSRPTPAPAPTEDLEFVLSANSPPEKPGPAGISRTVTCYLLVPESELHPYTKTGPYRNRADLAQDFKLEAGWIRNILLKPTPQGLQITYKKNTPFTRLGIRSGDILLALNHHRLKAKELPAFFHELSSAESLTFQIERNGKPLTLTQHLGSPSRGAGTPPRSQPAPSALP